MVEWDQAFQVWKVRVNGNVKLIKNECLVPVHADPDRSSESSVDSPREHLAVCQDANDKSPPQQQSHKGTVVAAQLCPVVGNTISHPKETVITTGPPANGVSHQKQWKPAKVKDVATTSIASSGVGTGQRCGQCFIFRRSSVTGIGTES